MGKDRKKLCILGTAESMKQAPFEDDSFDIWGMSALTSYKDCKRIDRLFEFHPRRYWGQLPVLMRMEKETVPVYMQDHYPEIPTSVKYPREEIKEMFHLSSMGENLFVTNSITWIILLGLYEGYKDFALFGVHMANDMEYSYQQPSCSWALGIIHGRMLAGEPYSLEIAEESSLLKARYEYGFDEPSKLMIAIEARKNGLKNGLEQTTKQMAELQQAKLHTEGSLKEAEYWYNHVMGYR